MIEIKITEYFKRDTDKCDVGMFNMIDMRTGIKYFSCRHFVKGSNEWFSFQQEKRGDKWFDLVRFLTPELKAEFCDAVLKAIKAFPAEAKRPISMRENITIIPPTKERKMYKIPEDCEMETPF